MHWVNHFGKVLMRVMVFPFATWKVEGRENLPASGPLLIVCNHLHLADPPMVAASLPLKCMLMAKEELWHDRWSRFWVENFGAFPVKRGGIDREAIRLAEDWLKRGMCVVMFPEGKRSYNAQMQPAQPGAVLIASRVGVPILPIAITGTEKFKRLRWCFFHHPQVKISIGRPFSPPSPNGRLSREQRRQLIDDIMRKIAALLPAEYRGVYGGDKNAPD
jgi:1-acyl-sn-glycerol-3-phosphate acyltransferase